MGREVAFVRTSGMASLPTLAGFENLDERFPLLLENQTPGSLSKEG